ncbi:response regulator transcription factor [Microlunatus lacustris]
MNDPIAVYVRGMDPISQAGVVSQLRMCPEVKVLDEHRRFEARLAVVVADQVDGATTDLLHDLRRTGPERVLLIATLLDDQALRAAAEAGVCGLLRRSDATAGVLVQAISRVARGHGEIPADLLGRLLEQVGKLQRQVLAPRGLTFSGLTPRETEVLRLVADGHDTAEIASRLCYSERTVKNVLHDLNTRLQLRNRSHAVAYAVREGLI